MATVVMRLAAQQQGWHDDSSSSCDGPSAILSEAPVGLSEERHAAATAAATEYELDVLVPHGGAVIQMYIGIAGSGMDTATGG